MIRTVLLVVALAAAGGCSAGDDPPATATSGTPQTRVDRYVALEEAAVQRHVPRAALISLGKSLCTALHTGNASFSQLVTDERQSFGALTAARARIVVQLAVVTFCPDQKSEAQ